MSENILKAPYSDNKRELDEDFPDLGKSQLVADFLPAPSELFPSGGELSKVTIQLESNTVAAFRRMAEQNGVKYQKLIREVLKRYAQHYDK